jgi:arylsulfatase A-like enzyme
MANISLTALPPTPASSWRPTRRKPFFAMLSFYSVHTPLIGRPDLVAKYKKKAAKINGQEFGDEEQIFGTRPRKVRILQKHAVYAAMVEAMDQAVGKVMKKVNDLGLEDEVVICFTSDNGGLSTSEGISDFESSTAWVKRVGSMRGASANLSS